MKTEQQGDNFKIFSYDFADFLAQVQSAILKGYRLDYSKNETYPFTTIGQYWVVLTPERDDTPKQVVVQELVVKIDATEAQKVVEQTLDDLKGAETEGEPVKKTGRKNKAG